MNKLSPLLLLTITQLIFMACKTQQQAPDSFVNLKQFIPNIEIDLRYHGSHNFTGRPVNGYDKPIVYLSKEAAIQLRSAQTELNKKGLGFKVFDAYRPQRAVNNFISWAKNRADTLAKNEFYPGIDKKDLFKLGYIAERSGHSRGSTIDLSIINLSTKKELDMGTGFDFFGEQSHHNYVKLTEQQKANRLLLKQLMEKYGFKAYSEEWWHYTLLNEPFKETYFNFPIK